MASFNGKWKLVKVENFDAYLDAIGMDAGVKAKVIEGLDPSKEVTQELTVTADGIEGKVVSPVVNRQHAAKFGESFQETTMDGSQLTVVIKLEGGKLVENVTGKYESTNVREIIDGKLVYSLTAKGVTTVRTYEKV